jgi:hypothetical protein
LQITKVNSMFLKNFMSKQKQDEMKLLLKQEKNNLNGYKLLIFLKIDLQSHSKLK